MARMGHGLPISGQESTTGSVTPYTHHITSAIYMLCLHDGNQSLEQFTLNKTTDTFLLQRFRMPHLSGHVRQLRLIQNPNEEQNMDFGLTGGQESSAYLITLPMDAKHPKRAAYVHCELASDIQPQQSYTQRLVRTTIEKWFKVGGTVAKAPDIGF